MRIIPKPIETLWTLFTGPIIWAVHFLACYVTAAVWCAKRGGSDFGLLQAGLGAVTLVALALIVFSAWLSWRQWGFGTQDPPHDDATVQERRLFQGYATLLLSGLSFMAVLYVTLPFLFIDGCAS